MMIAPHIIFISTTEAAAVALWTGTAAVDRRGLTFEIAR
jgi:hypothetical protein